MSYFYDRFERNELHAAERDEWRSAVGTLTESERLASCGHTKRIAGRCVDCPDVIDREEA